MNKYSYKLKDFLDLTNSVKIFPQDIYLMTESNSDELRKKVEKVLHSKYFADLPTKHTINLNGVPYLWDKVAEAKKCNKTLVMMKLSEWMIYSCPA